MSNPTTFKLIKKNSLICVILGNFEGDPIVCTPDQFSGFCYLYYFLFNIKKTK